jgi:thymidylate kinase
MYSPRFIVIEGLDGSGKSTLAANLATVLSAQAMATPSHHVATVRKFFDRARSPYSRCYYLVSNYILAEFCRRECARKQKNLTFVVDRYFTSTVAYNLCAVQPHGLLEYPRWPCSLIKPETVVVLLVPHATRATRIQLRNRGAAQTFNDWDQVLQKDAAMGDRILAHIVGLCKANDLQIVRLQPSDSMSRDEVTELARQHLSSCSPALAPSRVDEYSDDMLGKLAMPAGAREAARNGAPPVLVALVGGHASGKTSVGRLLHERGYAFLEELGDTLREDKRAPTSAYRNPAMRDHESWDEFVFRMEIERQVAALKDAATLARRQGKQPDIIFVETWHVQNLAWACFRAGVKDRCEADPEWSTFLSRTGGNFLRAFQLQVQERGCQGEGRSHVVALIEAAVASVAAALASARVLCVQLCISEDTRVRRDTSSAFATSAVVHDAQDAREQQACASRLDRELCFFTSEFLELFSHAIPLVRINNDEDGQQDEVVDAVLLAARALVHDHQPIS